MQQLYKFYLLLLMIMAILLCYLYIRFKQSNYQKVSQHSFLKTLLNKGFWGEYKIFSLLENLAASHQLLTNLYIPRKDGTTTEIDLLFINEKGLFVIESKNYSGWIYGDEKQKYWTQVFENKQKFRFFNPIWQNSAHINALKEVLPNEFTQGLHSIIVFNNQCELKKITVNSTQVKVIQRYQLKTTINSFQDDHHTNLTNQQISEISQLLLTFTHPDEAMKKAHIEAINQKKTK